MKKFILPILLVASFGTVGCGGHAKPSKYTELCKVSGYTGSDVQKCVKQMEVFDKAASGKIDASKQKSSDI